MGTRRPLILQMVHDPTATTPRCKLRDEDSQQYGPVITPESSVSDAIRQRTESHLRQLGASVSSKPIFLRAEFAYCGNLTLVDTPGFILKARSGEADSMPDDIMKMVKEQIALPHRLIVFLQQSSVEWCSSMWMSVIQDVDPTFRRTVRILSVPYEQCRCCGWNGSVALFTPTCLSFVELIWQDHILYQTY